MSEARQYIYHTLSSFNIRYVLLLNPLCSTRPNGLVKHNGFRSSIYLMLNSEGCDKYIMMLAVYLCNIINYDLGILNQPEPELFSYIENRAGYEIAIEYE